MGSRQMAFHIDKAEILKLMGMIHNHGVGKKKQTLGEVIDGVAVDEKQKDKMRAVYVAMDQCIKRGREEMIFRMKRITAWRTANSDKFDLETAFDRNDPPVSMLKEAGLA